MATLVLRTVKGSPLTNAEVDGNFSNINAEVGVVGANVGVLSQLTTTNKSNVVAAINEVYNKVTSNITITGGSISNVTSITTTGNIDGNSALFSDVVTAKDFNSTSDITLKQNVFQISDSLNIIDKLTGIEFTWKNTDEKSYGLSAQQVESIIPAVVKTRADGTKGINYNNLIAFLVEAVKELKTEINILKNKK